MYTAHSIRAVTNMVRTTSPNTIETRAKTARRRGNFYDGMGFALLAGLLLVVGLGVLGITSLGLFSLATAMAMIGLAIGVVALISFITLMSMRKTLKQVGAHETALVRQADHHAALAARVQAEVKAAQVQRDRDQDLVVAELSRRQDTSDMTNAVEAEMNRSERDRAENFRVYGQPLNNGDGDPFRGGDVHPVQDVEGIGEHFGPLLDKMGVSDTEKLWHAHTGDVALALDLSPLVVEQWKCQSELMAIDGIGKQYAELIVRTGVCSIRELAAQNPERLLTRVHRLEARVGRPIQGNTIGLKTVETWIDRAGSHEGHRAPAQTKGTNANTKGRPLSSPSGGR